MPRHFTLAALLVLLAVTSRAAQDSSSASSAPKPAEAPGHKSAEQSRDLGGAKKPKKVWTNDNLGDATGTVSLVGNAQDGAEAKPKPGKVVDAKYVTDRRTQLQRLQAQLDDVNKRIGELNSFNKGETNGSAGMQLHKGYSLESTEVQVRKLQEKKKQLESAIDIVLDDARKKGIEPGQLR